MSKEPCVVAHLAEEATEREVEGTRAAAHTTRVGDPIVHQGEVAVEEFSHRERVLERTVLQQDGEEVAGDPLDEVQTKALDIQGPGQPVGAGEQSAEDVARRLAMDRSQAGAEGLVFEDMGILRDIRPMEAGRVLGKAPAARPAFGIHVAEGLALVAAATAPVVLDQVHIDVQVIGPQHGHAPGQLLAGTVARRQRPPLILRAQVVVIKGVVTDGLDPGGSLPHGGQPDGREPRLANRVGLNGKVIPPPVGTQVAVCRARNPFVARPEKRLQKNAHDGPAFRNYRRQLRCSTSAFRDYTPYPREWLLPLWYRNNQDCMPV